MTAKRQSPLLERDLGERYSVALTEFQKNLYVHIKDRFGKGDGKRVTLHSDGLVELSKVIPELLQKVEGRKKTLQDDPPAKRSRDGGQYQ